MKKLSKKTILFFTVLLTIASCSTPMAQNNLPEKNIMENTDIDFKVLSSGAYSGMEDAVQQLVNDETSYQQLFSKIMANRFPAKYLEYQDSKTYLFITFGKKSSGGLDYEVSKVEQNSGNLVVTLKRKPKSRFSTQAVACPYIVLEINKTDATKLVINYEEAVE